MFLSCVFRCWVKSPVALKSPQAYILFLSAAVHLHTCDVYVGVKSKVPLRSLFV